jgi:DNA polymerase III delta subunit
MQIEGKNIQITLMAYTSLLDAIDKKLNNTGEPFDLVLFGFFFMKTESELKELRQEVQKLIEAAHFNLGK